MQAREEGPVDDEISLLDIYDFLRDGWLTIIGLSALGLLAGVALSLWLPVKYQAGGMIEPGKVGVFSTEQGVSSQEVEPAAVLAERMRSPSFYSDQTLSICEVAGEPDSRQTLVRALAPSVARNSSFVSVAYQASSVEAAKACIDQVLVDVIASQKPTIDARLGQAQNEVANAKKQLNQANEILSKQTIDHDQSLAVAREQLIIAREELKSLNQASESRDPSLASVQSLKVLSKRNEIQQLESQLLGLQSNFNESLATLNLEMNRLSDRLLAWQAASSFPNTREAQFAAPVFASEVKVAPRRGLIVAAGVLIGGFAGLLILIARRVMAHIRVLEAKRRTSP